MKTEQFYLYNKNTKNGVTANEQRLPCTIYNTTFTVNSEWCPIVTYEIYEKINGRLVQYSGTDIRLDTGAVGLQEIVVSTALPMTKTIYVRALTLRDIDAFSPGITFQVCGQESVQLMPYTNSSLNYTFTVHTMDPGLKDAFLINHTVFVDRFFSTNPLCPIASYGLVMAANRTKQQFNN